MESVSTLSGEVIWYGLRIGSTVYKLRSYAEKRLPGMGLFFSFFLEVRSWEEFAHDSVEVHTTVRAYTICSSMEKDKQRSIVFFQYYSRLLFCYDGLG